MEVSCTICGQKCELSKLHKDYLRLAKDPQGTFICKDCANRVRYQTQEGFKPKKPL